jgi:hypothetical protein
VWGILPPIIAYSFRHLHSSALQPPFQETFTALTTLSYHLRLPQESSICILAGNDAVTPEGGSAIAPSRCDRGSIAETFGPWPPKTVRSSGLAATGTVLPAVCRFIGTPAASRVSASGASRVPPCSSSGIPKDVVPKDVIPKDRSARAPFVEGRSRGGACGARSGQVAPRHPGETA